MQVPRRKRPGTGRGRSRAQRKAVLGKKGAMLDLFAVKNQIDEMVADERRAQEDYREKLEMAVQAYRGWQRNWQKLAEKIARSRTSWLMPGLVEGLDLATLPSAATGKDQHRGDGRVADLSRPARNFLLFPH